MLSTLRQATKKAQELSLTKTSYIQAIRSFTSKLNDEAVERTKIDPNLTLERNKSSGNSKDEKRPVVLLLSWLAAKRKHLNQFSKVYLRSGCDVLVVDLKPHQILLPTVGAQVVAKNVVNFLQQEDFNKRPILVHGFSTGGYLYSEILQRMINAESEKGEITGRIIGQIYDSMADIHNIPEGFSKALLKHGSFLQRGVASALKSYLNVMDGVATQHYCRGSKIFYNNPVNVPSLFIYSHTDPVGDAATIQSAIKSLQTNMKYENIYSKAFEDSPHVSHMYRHKEEYLATLKWFLEKLEYFKNQFEDEKFGRVVRVKTEAEGGVVVGTEGGVMEGVETESKSCGVGGVKCETGSGEVEGVEQGLEKDGVIEGGNEAKEGRVTG